MVPGRGVCSSHGLCPTTLLPLHIDHFLDHHLHPSSCINTTPWQHPKTHLKKASRLTSNFSQLLRSTMSTCGNCDCADKSQCVKKGNSYGIDIIETEKSYVETVVMEVPAAHEGNNCKCGDSCPCTNCTCGQ